MPDPNTGKTRDQGTTLSLENLLLSFTIPMLRASSPAPSLPAAGTEEQTQTSTPPDGPAQIQTQQQQIAQLPIVLPQCTMHNAGNDAMLCLFALQKLLDPAGTRVPSVKKGRVGRPGAGQQQQQQQLGNTAGVYVNGYERDGGDERDEWDGCDEWDERHGYERYGHGDEHGDGPNADAEPNDEPHDDWELTHACSHVSRWKP